MPRLSRCRRLLLRSGLTLPVLWLLCGMLLLAGMPRLELHVHAADFHGPHHHHAGDGETDHSHDAVDSGPAADENDVHGHLVSVVTVALAGSNVMPVVAPAPNRWLHEVPPPPLRTAAVSPPHRPPIG